ncbi:hypothetical protein D1007_35427 [Hordeum vulgare]|nr:hypothetical protein D1007_35427 [Hordeum vulgare]
MADSGSNSDQSGSFDWRVIRYRLEEAMAFCIALRRSWEDNAPPTIGYVWHDSIASAQWSLGSFVAGSARQPSNLPFPSSVGAEHESHWDRCGRHRKERIRASKARLIAEMTTAEAAQADADEEATCALIVKTAEDVHVVSGHSQTCQILVVRWHVVWYPDNVYASFTLLHVAMATKCIIGALIGSLGVAYVCDTIVSDKKIFGGTVCKTATDKEWFQATDAKFQAWPRTAGPPVIMNPISRQNFIVKNP